MSEQLVAGLGGAFIGAILTALSAWWLQRNQQISAKKEELRNTIMALLDFRKQTTQDVPQIQDPQVKEMTGLFINQKRTIYLQAAETIVEDIPKHVSSTEYGALAYELWLESDFDKAEEYYRNAARATKSTIAKSSALRARATFYFGQHPNQNFALGKKYYQQAIDTLEGSNDDYSLYTKGFAYQWWGLTLRGLGLSTGNDAYVAEGNEKISLARSAYEAMSKSNQLRNQSLEWLQTKIKAQDDFQYKALQPNASNLTEVGRPTDASQIPGVPRTAESGPDTNARP